MRFPINVWAVHLSKGQELPIAFFEGRDGDLVAIRNTQQWVGSDFASLMKVVLPEGDCHFRVPTLWTPADGSERIPGILRLVLSMKPAPGSAPPIYEALAWLEESAVVGVGRTSAADVDLMVAIEQTMNLFPARNRLVPARCICCRFSDYEPHTTVGNLRCYLGQRDVYEVAAEKIRQDSTARQTIFSLPSLPVDDFGTCAAFAIRPTQWGYRG